MDGTRTALGDWFRVSRLSQGPRPAALSVPEERIDGRDKVTGAARYVADQHMPGMLVARFLESPYPHARIRAVRADGAMRVAGVHAVLTGADTGALRLGRRLLDWPILASDVVRFIGDRVAVVAAETVEAAEEALSRIDVDYEELPVVVDVRAALAPDAPILHPDPSAYLYIGGDRPAVPHLNIQGHHVLHRGEPDIEAVFAGAARVFEHDFTTPAIHPGYLEPHGCIVWVDDLVHVVTANKTPYLLRKIMGEALDIPEEQIEVDSGLIGGDFGGKGFSVDEYACYLLARRTGRPIRSITTSIDELRTMSPRHATWTRARTAVDADGRILAHHARVLMDGGAYAAGKQRPGLTLSGSVNILSAYRVPNVHIEVSTVYTNHSPASHIRAPGQTQASFVGESHMDMISRALAMDPLDYRILNAVREGDTTMDGETIREPRAIEVLETLRRESGWDGRAKQPNVGRGIALAVRHVGTGKTTLRLRQMPDGTFVVTTAVPDQGTGTPTVIRRVLASTLGIDEGRIRINRRSTLDGPADAGVGGSKVTHLASRAIQVAAERLLAVIANGAVVGPEGLEVEGTYDGTHGEEEPGDFSFCGYCVDVEVDPETGAFRITDVLLVVDVGTIINPSAHLGQLVGGFVMGLGSAVMEELVREDGQVVNATLGEAKLPTSMDIPPLRIVYLNTDIGPGAWGAKMAGELTNTAVPAAVANAIDDACGVRVVSLPVNAEKIWLGLTARLVD